MLSEGERIKILMMRGWGDRVRTYAEVQNLFNETFRNGAAGISKSSVFRTVQRFEQHGSVKDLQRSGRPSTVNDPDMALDVVQSFVEDPHSSVRKVAQQRDVSKSTVHKIVKKNQFKPYKVHLVQQLSEDDYDRRMEFCETIMQKVDEDPRFLSKIVFSDEATFELSGFVNRHNCRFWDNENPHWQMEVHTQYPQKVNVWAGIIDERVIGPFFIEGNLTAVKYVAMLRDEIVPAIRNIPGVNLEEIWFQQDGAPAHFGLIVREFLNQTFPRRWIGRRGAIEWPPRSPDLTPLDFFLWGYVKSKIYATKPETIEELRRRISDEINLIPREYCRKSVENVYIRMGHCQAVNGSQFEPLV